MSTITKPNTFTAGTTIRAAQVNSNFDTIYNDYNGNITNANIKSDAAIVGSKLNLTSPGPIGGTVPGTGAFSSLTAPTITATTSLTAAVVTANSIYVFTSIAIPTSEPSGLVNGMIWLA